MAVDKSNFEKITFAISILTGLSFILFKIIDYFNNNIVRYSPDLQAMISFLVTGLLIEITIILCFLILKGYSISLGDKEDSSTRITEWTNWLFKLFFKGLIGLSVSSVTLLLLIVIYNMFNVYEFFKDPNKSIIGYFFSFATVIIIIYEILISTGLNRKIIFGYIKKFLEFKYRISLSLAFILFVLAPSYLLMGSYSIDVFPQSNADSDILTIAVRETGNSYNKIYINLYKFNSSSEIFWSIDNITINNSKEALSNRISILGKKYNGVWYLNINTSILQPGNYLLHVEVTDDLFKRYLGVEVSRKQADKLFYIPPKSMNYSFNHSQAS
ncbi:MAG TPA: hypothetical protein VIO58_08750 [Candidatus Methanoperedens sp.]